MIHTLTGVLAAVGNEEASPLSVNSTLAEILRLVQVGIFAGILYLINQVKNSRKGNDEAHGAVNEEIRNVRHDVKNLRQELIATGVLHATKRQQKKR